MHGGGFDVATLDGVDTARTLTRRYDSSPCHDRGPDVIAFSAINDGGDCTLDQTPTLTCGGGGGHGLGMSFASATAVRRLTPVECERLQGFPDQYTAIPWRGKDAENCPDGPRYKALGNSMAVPVMRWIGERIDAIEILTKE